MSTEVKALMAESDRLQDSLAHWITLRGALRIEGADLGGELGKLMLKQLGFRFQATKSDITNFQLRRWFESTYHHQRRIVQAVHMAHLLPARISGALASWDLWKQVRRRMCLNNHLAAKGELAIGVGSCGMRPTWAAGETRPRSSRERKSALAARPPSVKAVPASHLMIISAPENPLIPLAVIERHIELNRFDPTKARTICYYAWDLRDPSNPVYGRYSSLHRFVQGDADWSFEGDVYPWITPEGDAILPWSFYQGRLDAEEILPVSGLAEDTWKLMIELTWLKFPSVIRGWDIPMPYGDEKITGLENSRARPTAYVPIHGKGIKGVAVTPSAAPHVRTNFDTWRDLVAIAADRYDRRLQVIGGREAPSGIALEMEASQEHQAFTDQETRWAPADAGLLSAWRLTWNRLGAFGLHGEAPIPEGEIIVNYDYRPTPAARKLAVDEERQAMLDGPGSPVTYHMIRRGMDVNDAEEREAAKDQLRVIQREREEFAALLPKPQPAITLANQEKTP